MTQLATQTPSAGGLTPTLAAASVGGDTMNAGPGQILRVVTSGTPCTVTIASPNTCSRNFTHPLVVAVGATAEVDIPIPSFYGNTSGVASITYSAVTGVTVAALASPVVA